MIVFPFRSLRSNFLHGLHRLMSLSSLLVGTAAVLLTTGQPTYASERLYFTYGPLGRSLSIEELRNFAETGETTRQLRWYLNLANVEPERFRQVLTKQIPASLALVDRITYSLPGEFALSQIGEIIHTKSHQANIQALRSALILSVSEDDRLSFIELLENYPTDGIYIDGVVLARVANDVKGIVDDIEPVVVAIEDFLEGLVCDCENVQSATAAQ